MNKSRRHSQSEDRAQRLADRRAERDSAKRGGTTSDSADASNTRGSGDRDFQQSVERLEKVVQEFVGAATSQLSGKATALIDETAERLEREIKDRDSGASSEGGRRAKLSERRARRRGRSGAARSGAARSVKSRRLYRDRSRQKISGVCAGIAKHLGTDTWVIRCVAVSGLLFLPHITVPAYIIASFVIPKAPRNTEEERAAMRDDHSSPAPELGLNISPRRSLRNIQADLSEAELRLRRMETHVTSGKYELERELHKIEDEPKTKDEPRGQAT